MDSERIRISPVIEKGDIVVKKKNVLQRFVDAFFVKSFSEVAEDVKQNHIKPAIKNMIISAVNTTVTGLLYDNAIPKSNGTYYPFQNYSWNGVQVPPIINYTGANRPVQSQVSLVPGNYVSSYEELEIQPNPMKNEDLNDAARKANDVLRCLNDQLARYHKVSIGDLYDACGVTCQASYFNYGWVDLTGAGIKATPTGFRFALPAPVPLR